MQIMQHRYMHKAVTGCIEAKKLLSYGRQSEYKSIDERYVAYISLISFIVSILKSYKNWKMHCFSLHPTSDVDIVSP